MCIRDRSTQARILRVLTEQAFVRVGGHRQIRVDVRVVSSTARDLEREIAERRFREDLFYRLNVVPVAIPSLAERREDIPALVDHFFARFAADQGVAPPEVAMEAMAALQSYEWPGNVRQLRNVVERTIILTPRERGVPNQRAACSRRPSRISRSAATSAGCGSTLRGFGSIPPNAALERCERSLIEEPLRLRRSMQAPCATRIARGV